MERVLPSRVEAVLLYDGYAGYEPRELLSLINEAGSQFDQVFKWVPGEDTKSVLQFTAEELGIEVVHGTTALSSDGFSDVLASGFTQMTFPRAAEVVENHQQHVFITVGKLSESGEIDFEEGEFNFAVNLLKSLIMIYISRTRPLAIHWIQSNKLLTAKQFAQVALEERDISLLIHPSIYAADQDAEDGAEKMGFRTFGANTLIGREILFEETIVDVDRLFERALQLIYKMRETGLMIPDGDTFGVDENEMIRVRHIEDEHSDAGLIQLTYERCLDFGIGAEVLGEEAVEDEKPDPENPIERALQQRIEQLKADEELRKRPHDVDASSTEGEEESGPKVEPWQGVVQKQDISALRALARGESTAPVLPEKEETPAVLADADNEESVEDKDAKSSGILTKVSGIFSRKP